MRIWPHTTYEFHHEDQLPETEENSDLYRLRALVLREKSVGWWGKEKSTQKLTVFHRHDWAPSYITKGRRTSWIYMYDENGELLDEDLMEKLTSAWQRVIRQEEAEQRQTEFKEEVAALLAAQ